MYTLLGTIVFVCLGFAATTITRRPNGAQGRSNAVALTLAMMSGVFFDPGVLPGAVRDTARFHPLEPLANGHQSLYVTDAAGLGLDARNLAVLAA